MIVTGTSIVASRPPVPRASTCTTYAPSGSPAPSKTTVRAPARRQVRGSSSATAAPFASRTLTVTFALAVSVKPIVVVSACPSPFGEIVAGEAVAPVSWRAVVAAGAVAAKVPSAGVAPRVWIRQRVPAAIGPCGSHVQSTRAPLPSPRPSSTPAASTTTADHGRADDSFAVRRVPPVSSGVAAGA